MDTKRIIKNIAFIVFVPSLIVGCYYGYKFIKNKWSNKSELPLNQVDKETLEMREKYKNINNFEDFFNGVIYQPSHSIAGYDLIELKKINDLQQKITLDELKKIYEFSKLEKVDGDNYFSFLDLIHKVYP